MTAKSLAFVTLAVLALFTLALGGAIVGGQKVPPVGLLSPMGDNMTTPVLSPIGDSLPTTTQNESNHDVTFIPTPALQAFTYSHYWPAWGGVNGNPNGTLGTTGLAWRPWAYKAIACPQTPDFPNWTRIMIVRPASIAGEWICLDHGSYIVVGKAPNGYGYPGVAWLDFLRPEFDIKYGSLIYGWMESTK